MVIGPSGSDPIVASSDFPSFYTNFIVIVFRIPSFSRLIVFVKENWTANLVRYKKEISKIWDKESINFDASLYILKLVF